MTDFMEATPPRTAELENEIHRTRNRMGQEIEAIGEKFRPERIKQRAKAAVSRKGANLFRTAKENPLPTALVALGLTMLFKARNKHQVQDVTSAAREKVSHAAEQVGEKARRTSTKLEQFFESNPIIAGAGVVVLGAAVGALIPETRKEREIMGRARDDMVERAKNVAHHAQSAIEQKMSESGTQGSETQTQGQSQSYSQRQSQY